MAKNSKFWHASCAFYPHFFGPPKIFSCPPQKILMLLPPLCLLLFMFTDNQRPLITCPADISQNANTNQAFATISLPDPVISDNSGSYSLTSNAPQQYTIRTWVVTFTATDRSGNTATCSVTVTVTGMLN